MKNKDEEELNKLVADMLEKMVRLMKRDTDQCMRCDRKVIALEKIGRCVYARPCGCRLWQGTVPEPWQGRVPKSPEVAK